MSEPNPVPTLSFSLRHTPLVRAALFVAMVGVMLVVSPARADEFVDRVNAAYADIRDERRSDPIILAALAEMEHAPAMLTDQRQAALYPASGSAWSQLAEWAAASSQATALDALDSITKEQDYRRAMVFAQPYGLEQVGADPEQIAFIQAGLYTDLGDPPLLAAAQHLYLRKFDDLAKLVHVEATRRLEAGDGAGALDVLADLIQFGRQILDREFHAEKVWAFEAMILAAERMRDVAYNDGRGAASLTAEEFKTAIDRLLDVRGPISIERIRLPKGDFIAGEQLIATVMEPRGRIRPEVFASTMSRLESTERPLRLFGEAARWRDAAQMHVGWERANKTLDSLRNDFDFRWSLSPFDPQMARAFAIEGLFSSQVVADRVAAVSRSVPDMRDLFVLRQLLRTELLGTQNALGLAAFHVQNGRFPLDLSGIRPKYIKDVGIDPFNPAVADGRVPTLKFFVPVRDTADRFSGQPNTPPHEISILVDDAPNVSILLREDQFVLYSVGADGSAQWADEVQNSPDAPPGRDYLLWPPVLSVVRDTLLNDGVFN
ncbi:MAG: hypothetical protein Q9O74_06000 [Planctomycetota bacterium]|nr:hypothetical protein [Planctomycetota bacterium]